MSSQSVVFAAPRTHNNLVAIDTSNTFRTTSSAFDAEKCLAKIKCTSCGCWKQRGASSCKLCGTAGKPITNLSAVAKLSHMKNVEMLLNKKKNSQQQISQVKESKLATEQQQNQQNNDLSYGENLEFFSSTEQKDVKIVPLEDDFVSYCCHNEAQVLLLAQQDQMFFGSSAKNNQSNVIIPTSSSATSSSVSVTMMISASCHPSSTISSKKKNSESQQNQLIKKQTVRNQVAGTSASSSSAYRTAFGSLSASTTTTSTTSSKKVNDSTISVWGKFKIESVNDTYSDKLTYKNHRFRD